MKIGIFSDLHAHAWPEFSAPMMYRGTMLNSRLVDACKVIYWVRGVARKFGLDRILFGGDLFHRKNVIDVAVYNAIAAAMWRLAQEFAVDILAGNHDLTRRSGEGEFSHEHALYALSHYDNVSVVDQPCLVSDIIGLVPYASDRDTTLQAVEMAVNAGAKMLLLHAGVSGAVAGPIEVQPYEPISVDDLPTMPIYSGHYHKPQTVQRRVTYIGSPLEHMRGDRIPFPRKGSRERGMMVIDLDAPGKFKRLAYPGPRFVAREAEELTDVEDVAGHFVDLMAASSSAAEKATQILQEAQPRGIKVHFVAAAQASKVRMDVEVEPGRLPSVELLCDKYVESAGDTLDPKLLRQLAQESLHAADTEG